MSTIKERNRLKESKNIKDKPVMNEKSTEKSVESQDAPNTNGTELPGESKKHDKSALVLAIHFCNVLYSTSFWINVAVYPYITKSIGVDMITFGYLQTTFGALQLLGGPVYGRLGDIFGSRAVLMLAHSSGLISYFLLSLATNPSMLFISRIPSLLLHGVQGAQMVITDLTNHKERAVALGQISLSYGAGVIIGPFVGGQLSKYFSQKVAVLFAAFLSMFSIVFVMLFIPKSTRNILKKPDDVEATPATFNWRKITAIMSTPGVGFIVIIKFVAMIPHGIFKSMFAMVIVNIFKLTPAQHGMFTSYIGSLMILVQGFGIGFVTKKFSEKNTLVLSMILSTFAYMLWLLSYNASHLVVVVVPLVFGGALFAVVTNSILTKLVAAEDTGFVLGISFATQSLVRTVSPTIGGILLTHFGHTSFGVVGLIVCSTIALYLFMKERIHTAAS